MKLGYVTFVVLMCVVIEIKSERTRSVCQGCRREEYVRIKRAKYYSNPSSRFYNRPSMYYPIKGPFSYTPPPGYYVVEDNRPINYKPKVSSSRPINEELGNEDINNVMKFLSEQDLDNIVDFANEQKRAPLYERSNDIVNKREKDESQFVFNDNVSMLNDDNNFHHQATFTSAQQGFTPNNIEYSYPNTNELKQSHLRFSEMAPTALFTNKNHAKLNKQADTDRIMQSQPFSHLNSYENQERNENSNGANIFTDSSLMQEELLPKPTNLREDDYEASFTNNVPTIVKANTNSYKIENLGSLPLMNYHSKLESVDSYKVPHYTVTSPEKYRVSSMTNIPVEPAPPVSTAQEQSDAHLKATNIWTHKSKGTAYTLHDDGTLTLKRPTKNNYDYSVLIHR